MLRYGMELRRDVKMGEIKTGTVEKNLCDKNESFAKHDVFVSDNSCFKNRRTIQAMAKR